VVRRPIDLCTRIRGKDINHRLRTRECVYCGRAYQTAEVDSDWIGALTEEALRLERECERLRGEAVRLRSDMRRSARELRRLAGAEPCVRRGQTQ